ncbi:MULTISPECIES: ABC transporter ATP-binding protein [Thalassolituus]|uniref:ABC transporter ATP-binding protein n=1 Tax=Thalassolituus TaxID=187492 RepID=UPI0007CFC785|nr:MULTISPECIES: ABC transporter ATP-binding protein [Thalassolituus]KZY98199.1 ABC transporter [Oleibacter sp. HI0075]MAG43697.1 ABC transporter ATP-binding protein [Oceanospirillaceae bacterium]MEE3160058.1 ABC transporter ATP-binding protein [Pseudomonadota bacterium]HCG79145.1 ABC transporter ATP-binding protein [Oceanospirillales bacterium]MAX87496.1 ABC transporter ATP-binding protein [Oceanospirillaceae bacterium]|tara:strand:+ start:1344 stop:2243 length:900 start_codon:yes stop_codon:yes gene_type:complete
MTEKELPSYLDQSPEVKDRFDRLKQRPVTMEVKGLNKQFGEVTALKDINLKIHKREFVCVIGPSGCGKSTLIRILAGLEQASSGQVLLNGEAVTEPGPERGMVFQGYTLFPWLTVKKNIMFGLLESGYDKGTAESEAREWINLIGLTKFENSYPHQLSGGMKQRVAIARALANRPKVLLMDEPFGALDAQTRAKMQAYLLEIWKNIDITVFFITHDLDEAVYLADRILVLKANPGEVQEVVEVPVPQPRSPDQFMNPEFLATKQHIEELIHPPSEQEEDDDHLNLVRMVHVNDDVGSVF